MSIDLEAIQNDRDYTAGHLAILVQMLVAEVERLQADRAKMLAELDRFYAQEVRDIKREEGEE